MSNVISGHDVVISLADYKIDKEVVYLSILFLNENKLPQANASVISVSFKEIEEDITNALNVAVAKAWEQSEVHRKLVERTKKILHDLHAKIS